RGAFVWLHFTFVWAPVCLCLLCCFEGAVGSFVKQRVLHTLLGAEEDALDFSQDVEVWATHTLTPSHTHTHTHTHRLAEPNTFSSYQISYLLNSFFYVTAMHTLTVSHSQIHTHTHTHS